MSRAREAGPHDVDPSEHEAHASDCAYCPICALIATVRRSHPEVLEHLAVAARELMAALAVVVSEADGPGGRGPGDGRATTMRRIDIG